MARYWRIIALIVAGEMIFALPFHTQRFFRPSMLKAFEISNTELGDMFAAYGVAAMISYLLGGPLADRYPARNLITASLVATAAGGLYMATFPGVAGMSLLYGFWGASTVFLFWAALIRATRDWGGATSQGMAFGILDGGRGLAAAVFAGLAVSVLAAYLPADAVLTSNVERQAGLRTIILLYSAITLAAALLVWFAVPNDEGDVAVSRKPFSGVATVIRRPVVWAQAGIIICAYSGYKGLDNYALYAEQVLQQTEVEAARLATYGAYIRPVACIVAGLVADRFDSSRSILGLFLALTGAFGVLAIATPDTMALGVIYGNLIVTFFAVFALRGIYYALLEETNTPKHLTGSTVAVIAFVGYTPEIFFGPVTGRILDANPGLQGHLDYFTFLAGVAVLGVLVTTWLLWLKRSAAGEQRA